MCTSSEGIFFPSNSPIFKLNCCSCPPELLVFFLDKSSLSCIYCNFVPESMAWLIYQTFLCSVFFLFILRNLCPLKGYEDLLLFSFRSLFFSFLILILFMDWCKSWDLSFAYWWPIVPYLWLKRWSFSHGIMLASLKLYVWIYTWNLYVSLMSKSILRPYCLDNYTSHLNLEPGNIPSLKNFWLS